MATNPSTKKLIHITEESLAPVQVPLCIGTDYYMVTQQDIRRIEDIRFLSFNKLNQSGVLNPADSAAVELLFTILKAINTNMNCQKIDRSCCQQEIQKSQQCPPEPMEVSSNPTHSSCTSLKATTEQQLKWNKCTNTSAPFAFNYSRGTSTTDLSFSTTELNDRTPSSASNNPCSRSKTVKFSRGTNTNEMQNTNTPCLDAREQLKQRKIFSSSISW